MFRTKPRIFTLRSKLIRLSGKNTVVKLVSIHFLEVTCTCCFKLYSVSGHNGPFSFPWLNLIDPSMINCLDPSSSGQPFFFFRVRLQSISSGPVYIHILTDESIVFHCKRYQVAKTTYSIIRKM
jgi:hypothetical protein